MLDALLDESCRVPGRLMPIEECVSLCDSKVNASGRNVEHEKKEIFPLTFTQNTRNAWLPETSRGQKKKAVRISTYWTRTLCQRIYIFSLIFVFASQTNKFLSCLFYGYCLMPLLYSIGLYYFQFRPHTSSLFKVGAVCVRAWFSAISAHLIDSY